MSTRDDDQAWRAIVENYGERAVLDDPAPESAELDPYAQRPSDRSEGRTGDSPAAPGESPASAALPSPPPAAQTPAPQAPPGPSTAEPFPAEAHPSGEPGSLLDPDDPVANALRAEARFVPPNPPLPTLSPRQWIAWICVLGSPVAFVVLALLGTAVTGLLGMALSLCFVGGFAWLVAMMPSEPRDPWDDGSRV